MNGEYPLRLTRDSPPYPSIVNAGYPPELSIDIAAPKSLVYLGGEPAAIVQAPHEAEVVPMHNPTCGEQASPSKRYGTSSDKCVEDLNEIGIARQQCHGLLIRCQAACQDEQTSISVERTDTGIPE